MLPFAENKEHLREVLVIPWHGLQYHSRIFKNSDFSWICARIQVHYLTTIISNSEQCRTVIIFRKESGNAMNLLRNKFSSFLFSFYVASRVRIALPPDSCLLCCSLLHVTFFNHHIVFLPQHSKLIHNFPVLWTLNSSTAPPDDT